MRAHPFTIALMALALVGFATDAAAQDSPAHAHMGHVADGFRGTPDGMGLLPTAVAEAEVAAMHAGLAARDLTDLDAMQRHTGHVQHAVDPSVVENGPGAGYGVKQAASGAARHISMAADSEGATDNIRNHSNHVSTSANNTVARADRILELAAQIQEAESADAAAPLVEEMAEVAGQLVSGLDANGDGRVGWQEGEGGLEQASAHMGFMKRGEGMGG